MGAVLNEPDLCQGSFCHLYSVPGTENRPVRQLVSWHVTVHNGLHNVRRALMATITATS